MTTKRIGVVVATAAAGLLAALSFASGVAHADLWSIESAADAGFGAPPPEVVSVSGIAPFDQTVLEQGEFGILDTDANGLTNTFAVPGVLSTTEMFGLTNEDFVSNGTLAFPDHAVVDILSAGGFENIYVDLPGEGTGGANLITDTLVTPFGNFDIPTTLDAAAPAAATDWVTALDADWSTLLADFSALF